VTYYSFAVSLGIIGIVLTVSGRVIAKIWVKGFPQLDLN
jgi:hypothetical protein